MEIVTSLLLTELVLMFQFYNMDLPDEPTSQSDLTQRVAKETISTHVYWKLPTWSFCLCFSNKMVVSKNGSLKIIAF